MASPICRESSSPNNSTPAPPASSPCGPWMCPASVTGVVAGRKIGSSGTPSLSRIVDMRERPIAGPSSATNASGSTSFPLTQNDVSDTRAVCTWSSFIGVKRRVCGRARERSGVQAVSRRSWRSSGAAAPAVTCTTRPHFATATSVPRPDRPTPSVATAPSPTRTTRPRASGTRPSHDHSCGADTSQRTLPASGPAAIHSARAAPGSVRGIGPVTRPGDWAAVPFPRANARIG